MYILRLRDVSAKQLLQKEVKKEPSLLQWYTMKLLLILAFVGTSLAIPMVKRQAESYDSAPWWNNNSSHKSQPNPPPAPYEPPPPAPYEPASPSAHGPELDIDPSVIESIFGGPPPSPGNGEQIPSSGGAFGQPSPGSFPPSPDSFPPSGPYPSPHAVEVIPDKCECVPYYLCRNGEIITDGTGIIDIRIDGFNNSGPVGGNCPGYIEVCCKHPDTTPPPIPTPAPHTSQCGIRNPDGVYARITGFKEGQAQYGEFPWMAAILRVEEVHDGKKTHEVNLYQCGGSLIHPQVVLTAAHCVKDFHEQPVQLLKVRLGEWDTQTTNELLTHQDIYVDTVKIHENFKPGPLFNDVALLFMKEPAILGANVGTVCLPEQNTTFDYNTCWTTGWGKDQFGKEGKYQNILKEIDLPVVPHYECQDALRATRLSKYFKLHDSFMCAGGVAGKDACKGDGGSPLVCPIPNKQDQYVQAGIVAWGIACGGSDIPGVYVDVAKFADWIDNSISHEYNLASSYYKNQY